MKNSYKTAMAKVLPSDAWRADTLAAMQAVPSQPPKQPLSFSKKRTLIAACAVLALCIPAAIYVLDFGNALGTKGAQPQLASQQNVVSSAAVAADNQPSATPRAAANNEPSVANAEAGAAPRAAANNEPSVANAEAGAAPKAAQFGAKMVELTQETATEVLMQGNAFIQASAQSGGYETDGIIINSVLYDAQANAYQFDTTDKNGKHLILLVY